MKTLTTLTAVAALLAGMTIAGAQNMPSNPPENASPNQVNKGSVPGVNSGTQSPRSAKRRGKSGPSVTGGAKYCLQSTPGSSTLDCRYRTMAACQQIARTDYKNCVENPRSGRSTTGSRR
jgi:hypothetical protein